MDQPGVAGAGPPPAAHVNVYDEIAGNRWRTWLLVGLFVAIGRHPKRSSVAVTRGLLTKLDRNELQGVIAHELSHVRNFDIRLMLIVAVLLGMAAVLSDFIFRSMFWGGRGRDRGRGNPIL